MWIKFVIVTDTELRKGSQRSIAFFNMILTTKTHHKIDIKANITQSLVPLGKFLSRALFCLQILQQNYSLS